MMRANIICWLINYYLLVLINSLALGWMLYRWRFISLNNATKQLLIILFLGEKPDLRPSNREGIYSICLAPKLGSSTQTHRPCALRGRFTVNIINVHCPSTAGKGLLRVRLRSAPTPVPHRAFLTSTQPHLRPRSPPPFTFPRFTHRPGSETGGGSPTLGHKGFPGLAVPGPWAQAYPSKLDVQT